MESISSDSFKTLTFLLMILEFMETISIIMEISTFLMTEIAILDTLSVKAIIIANFKFLARIKT